MQLYAVVIVLASVAATQAAEEAPVQEQPDLEDVGKIANGETYALQCLLESGLKLDSLSTISVAELTDSGSKIKCLVKCFFEKTGFMDGQGKLQQDVVVEQLSKFMPKERIETLVKNCDIQEPDPCDTAYKVTECYFQNKAGLF
ncbi:odorant binding protein [Anopheles darlingi]|uniref:Odorant binding protein n=1 Tax=Anopheles darlingi TaxID=43151 RepID=W5J829_ANODA|nr:odorant binding protein [Anopheles darlingi]